MNYTFKKESILIDWIPIATMLVISMVFVVFAVTVDNNSMVIGSTIVSVFMLVGPALYVVYFKSFDYIVLIENTVQIHIKSSVQNFTIPDDIKCLNISADDLKIHLKNPNNHFVIRTHFLKNKSDFHKLFDKILKAYRSSDGKVMLNKSLLSVMNEIK